MSEVLKKFGRFFLLDQVGQGGMAEIFRARSSQSEGVARILVIKRIQSSFVESKEYADMFRSEINVMMGLQHPNIVQLHDAGVEAAQPYIAMEYVEGRNIRQFLTRLAQNDRMFPVLLSSYIVEQTASALHYAHHFRDRVSGKELNIVHRDISPQNVLISYDGNVKVIDFGIAKATVNSEITRAGVIKGKPSYLSPEQISGEALDGRSDIFALGIVLWELLTRKKLFAADNEMAAIKLIESCNTHVKLPSTLNPEVPHELDMIVIKALARNKEKRFQTGEEFQRALHRFIYSLNPDFNPTTELSHFAKDLFKKDLVEDRKELQRLNEKAEQLMQKQISEDNYQKTLGTIEHGRKPEETTTFVEKRHVPMPFQQKVQVELPTDYIRQKIPMEASPALRGKSDGRGWQHSQRPSSYAEHKKNQASKKEKTGGPSTSVILATAAAAIAVILFGPQMGLSIPGVHPVKTGGPRNVASKPEVTVNEPSISAGPVAVKLENREQVLLSLSVKPGGSDYKGMIKVLGGADIPIDPVKSVVWVPMDTPLEIHISKSGFPPYRRALSVASKGFSPNTREKSFPVEVSLDPGRVGFLSVVTTPTSEAIIQINGKTERLKTPFERAQVPAGTYDVKLRNDLLGMEKTVTVTVKEGQVLRIEETLPIKDAVSSK